ncbi:MAG: kinase [Oligoflexia bacterium]|nr:kinase [Oligoflexia bacterium]
MIIGRTPHRISFFGGGTDYPSYYLQQGGKVLGTAIDKYCYLSVRHLPPFFQYKHRVVYSQIENINEIENIDHPSVRAVMQYLQIDKGISIHHDGDIPAKSGMGSSSAFTVGLINGLYALNERMISKNELASMAIHVEQNIIKENVGSQDQTFATHGGLNLIEFNKNGSIVVQPVIMSADRLEAFEGNLMLFFSGLSRIASEIAKEQIDNTNNNLASLLQMKALVEQSYEILTDPNCNLDQFGELLHESWELKKRLSSKITNPIINQVYELARNAGAVGGKLLGAGGGGFMVFYVPLAKQSRVRQALKGFLNIPFKFDFEGSKIIVYQPSRERKYALPHDSLNIRSGRNKGDASSDRHWDVHDGLRSKDF